MDQSAQRHDPQPLVIGLSHASAPLELLERLTEAQPAADDLIEDLTSAGAASALVLATCNRLEIYAEADPGVPDDVYCEVLARHTGVPAEVFRPFVYARRSDDAIRHLFSVASGLDSVVIGEDQILGQVKQALERSRRLGRAGGVLGKAVQAALRVGKRVRNETGLNEAGRSLATAGLAVVESSVGTLTGATALVLGAGSMAGVVVAVLRRTGIERVHVANRTPEKARRLAETTGGMGFPLERVPELLAEVDLVIGCIAAGGCLVEAEHVRAAMEARAGRRLVLLDLALPHNISPTAAELPGVVYVDLRRIAERHGRDEVSEESVAAARRIVDSAVQEFRSSVRAAHAGQIVAALRNAAAEATEAELDRLARRLDDMDATARQEITRSVRRIVDRVLHQPTMRARRLATSSDGAIYIDALVRLFAPGEKEMEEVIA